MLALSIYMLLNLIMWPIWQRGQPAVGPGLQEAAVVLMTWSRAELQQSPADDLMNGTAFVI